MSILLTEEECQRVEEAIRQAEKRCSGEIHVHIAEHSKSDVRDSASEAFAKLGMHKTKLRNGVLIFLAAKDRKFAVIGDAGINSKVDQGFWDGIIAAMASHFREGDYVGGLEQAIEVCGNKLSAYFPVGEDDENELPDEVTFG